MLERSAARNLLVVFKAANGNSRFADKAEQLVSTAAELLDGHHGSASGLPTACMAPPTKGSGKGKETYEVKTKRIDKEISDATAAQDSEGLIYLWKVKNGHENSVHKPSATGGGSSKPNGKGLGKGGSKGSFAAKNQANAQLQYSGKELASAVDKAVAAALNKAAVHQTADDKKAENAERNRLKKLANEKEQADRKASGLVARECRLCFQPLCMFSGTYAKSAKCFLCKEPFAAPVVPKPTPAPPPPAAASEASRKAGEFLTQFQAAAVTGLKGYADAVKAAAPLPTPPPAPVRPIAAGTPAAAPLPQLLQPGPAAAAAAPATAPTPEQTAAAAELAAAKKLNGMRIQRDKAAAQLEVFADAPEVAEALRRCIAQLDGELLALQASREAALDPHQLGQVLTHRQQAASEAALAAKSTQCAADAAVVAFDTDARAVSERYAESIRTLVAAQAAEQEKAVADREAMVLSLKKGTDAAHAKAKESLRLLEHAQSTQAHQSGAAQAAQAQALAQHQSTLLAQQNAQLLHQQQQEELRRQLAETQAKLDAQAAELARQQTSLRPTVMVPAAVLPEPTMPEGKDADNAMYSLRASLLLLAEQDTPTVVTWGDLAAGHLHWPDVCRLVPHHLIDQSSPGIDPSAGPAPDAPVPRRVLELLRKQLDAIVATWIRDNAAAAAVAEEKHSRSAWAQNVLDQAKRVQELKRHAEPSATPQPASSRPRSFRNSAPAATSDAADPADDVAATQLDGSPASASIEPPPQVDHSATFIISAAPAAL